MNEQKKQKILTAIIIILILALVLMIGSIVYEEVINIKNQPIQNTNVLVDDKESNEEIDENDPSEDATEGEGSDNTIVDEETDNNNDTENNEEHPTEDDQDEVYVGEEENTTAEEPKMSTDDKVIDLVREEWGQDPSVTFSIEKKNGNKYRVAVRDNSTTVLAWYEVNTETWEVSEY